MPVNILMIAEPMGDFSKSHSFIQSKQAFMPE
jgi:hypothetical protein